MNRRHFLPLLGASILPARVLSGAGGTLPFPTIFRGKRRFEAIIRKGLRENWAALPIGERMIKAGRELHGVRYENFTLEIDNKIESPSANLDGLDCWTFFEICLGFGRMLGWSPPHTRPNDLLREIEFTRYRGGACHGNYLDRIHYLAEWYFENDARGVADDITRKLGGSRAVQNRKVSEMTTLWKHYRYLKNTPSLVPQMARHERRVEKLPVRFIPKDRVARIENKLRNGDIIGIVTRYNGGFCSHVGMIIRTKDGVARFFHASRDYRKVVIDKSISGYLHKYEKHAGIMVARPEEVSQTVTNPAEYRRNLKKLGGA